MNLRHMHSGAAHYLIRRLGCGATQRHAGHAARRAEPSVHRWPASSTRFRACRGVRCRGAVCTPCVSASHMQRGTVDHTETFAASRMHVRHAFITEPGGASTISCYSNYAVRLSDEVKRGCLGSESEARRGGWVAPPGRAPVASDTENITSTYIPQQRHQADSTNYGSGVRRQCCYCTHCTLEKTKTGVRCAALQAAARVRPLRPRSAALARQVDSCKALLPCPFSGHSDTLQGC